MRSMLTQKRKRIGSTDSKRNVQRQEEPKDDIYKWWAFVPHVFGVVPLLLFSKSSNVIGNVLNAQTDQARPSIPK